MTYTKVYRNFGEHPNLEFRNYRTSIEKTLESKIGSFKLGTKESLELLENFGKQAPGKYIKLWFGKNPILDSTYAFLSHPNQKELGYHEVTSYRVLSDGSLSKGEKKTKKDNWAEILVDPKKCLVAPHILAGKIVILQEIKHIPEYWSKTHVLKDFLKNYIPIGTLSSQQNWQNKETGEIYETPEILIPIDSINVSESKFLNK